MAGSKASMHQPGQIDGNGGIRTERMEKIVSAEIRMWMKVGQSKKR